MKMMPNQARQSRVYYKNQHGKSPNEGYCYEEGKLALASVGATKQAQKRCQAPTPIGSYGGTAMHAGTFRIVTGTIYGSNEADTSLKNTATTSGAALYYQNGTAERGTFSGETWNPSQPSGTLATTNNTINVLNGGIVP